ncbi:MAG TPA: rhodanese-like domain-containing protein [Syntrophorhabdaceae bacterium]|nr:rhodanese-like domain-containing protein [Syntrophorhabdaceae bacterium]
MTVAQRNRGITACILVFLALFSCSADTPSKERGRRYVDPEGTLSLIRDKKAVIVDTMSDLECMDHRIPGSLCLPLEEFENMARELLKDKKRPVIFYCESDECLRAGVSYDKAKAAGYGEIYILRGGLPAWKRAGYDVESVERVKREPVVSVKRGALEKMAKKKQGIFILDIRSEDDYSKGHLAGAVNIPLYKLRKRLKEIPGNRTVLVVDENGKRSFLASCYLINHGFSDVVRLYGGMEYEEPQKWKGGKG